MPLHDLVALRKLQMNERLRARNNTLVHAGVPLAPLLDVVS